MSQQNVELIRQGYEAFSRGDVEGWIAALDPHVELDERYIAPDAAVYRGHDGVRRWLQRSSEALGSPSFEVVRWFARGDAVVTEVIVHAHGVGSGIVTSARLAHAIRLRDRKAAYIASLPTVEEALAVVGLSERDACADSS
jgi:ketosteroid isomerase-like protein